jgi:hypothetical protein
MKRVGREIAKKLCKEPPTQIQGTARLAIEGQHINE